MTMKRNKGAGVSLPQWLGMSDLCRRYSVSDAQVRRWMRTDPDFPKPVLFGERLARWQEQWLDAYDRKKLAQQRLQQAA